MLYVLSSEKMSGYAEPLLHNLHCLGFIPESGLVFHGLTPGNGYVRSAIIQSSIVDLRPFLDKRPHQEAV